MNIFKAAYCRAQQLVFKLAIPILPYRSSEIVHSTRDIPALLKKHSIRSVLIVTDKSIHNLGLIDPLKDALADFTAASSSTLS